MCAVGSENAEWAGVSFFFFLFSVHFEGMLHIWSYVIIMDLSLYPLSRYVDLTLLVLYEFSPRFF